MLSRHWFAQSSSPVVLFIVSMAVLFASQGQAQNPSALELHVATNAPYYTCGTNGLPIYYTTWLTGTCSSNAVVTCTPTNASLFTPGVWPVKCTATDTCGNTASNGFSVTVLTDNSPPMLICPSNQIIYTAKGYAEVFYDSPFSNDDTDSEVYCTPDWGSQFPLGTNIVLCTGYDPCGNTNTCSFIVEVRKPQVNGGLSPAGGMEIQWSGDGLECADDLNGPWEPVPNPPGVFPTGSPMKFFRPAPGEDNGIPTFPRAEIAYVAVGLQSPDFTPGAGLDRYQDDDDFVNGSLIHTPGAGGPQNTWSGAINIPFKFWFYGQQYNKLCVSKNGLVTFSTNVANTDVGFASDPRKLPNIYLPPETIACFQSPHNRDETGYSVRAYLEGAAPHRQVWIVWHNLFKPNHGKTHTGLVLEESSNRILMADMYAEIPNGDGPTFNPDTIDPHEIEDTIIAPLPGTLACGVQHDTNSFTQVPASPNIELVNSSLDSWDNDFYIFKPYQVGRHIKGAGADVLDFIDQMAFDRTKKSNIPGTTVAVTYKGRLVYNKSFGFANVEKNIEMMPHHRACIGSVSKVITAAGIFKLIELGQLNLNDRITNANLLGRPWFFDAFQLGIDNNVHTGAAMAHLGAITLEHLMNHTSGYRRSSDQVAAADVFNGGVYSTSTYTNAVQWFMATQRFLTNAPGLLASYSNHGPGQLGAIIQYITGMSYEKFINDYLLKPHGVPRMRILKPQFLQQDPEFDARRYSWYSKGAPHGKNPFHGQPAPSTYNSTVEGIGSQGAWTGTARDLARFMAATDKLKNRSDLLPTNLLSIMESNAFTNVTGFAKGWARNESNGQLRHNGNIGYGASSLQKNTNGVNIAVVCNTGNSSFCDSFADAIRGAMTTSVLTNINQFYDLFGAQLQVNPNP